MAGYNDDPDRAADPDAHLDEGIAGLSPDPAVTGYKVKPQHVTQDGEVIVADSMAELIAAAEAAFVFPTEPAE